jgi:hypothetical protein
MDLPKFERDFVTIAGRAGSRVERRHPLSSGETCPDRLTRGRSQLSYPALPYRPHTHYPHPLRTNRPLDGSAKSGTSLEHPGGGTH